MMERSNLMLCIITTVLLGILSLVCLAVVLGLGVAGILEAQTLNLCERSNVTDDCVIDTPLETSLDAENPTSRVAPDVSEEFNWAYYLAGSTAASVLWSLVTLLAIIVLIKLLRERQKKDIQSVKEKTEKAEREAQGQGQEQGHGQSIALQEMGGATGEGGVEDAGVRRGRLSGVDEPDEKKVSKKEEHKQKLVSEAGVSKHRVGMDETDHYDLTKDYIGAYRVREWHGKPIRNLGVGGSIATLFFLLSLILSLECLLWAIALSYYHTNRLEKNISAFAVVQFLVGLLLPLLLFISSVLLAIVVDYITLGRIDARKRIKRFLPSVKFEEALEYDYWVIEDLFYFRLEKRDEHLIKKFGLWYSCDKTLSTWLLTFIVALSILLALSFFVDLTVMEEQTLSSCPVDAGLYDCFNRSSFHFVDCADPAVRGNVEFIHCFRFLRFAVDTNLLSSLAEAFAFYLATVAVFGRVFSAVKTLLHLHRTRHWGLGFIFVGGVAFVLTVVFLGIQDRFQIQVNFLSVMQVCMVCLFLVLVGILVVRGDWYEKIFDHKKVKPIAELLLRYDEISTAQVQQIERSYATEIKKDDPTSKHSIV